MTIYNVALQFDWQGEFDENDFSTYHCGSLMGAKKFIEKQKQIGKLLWYSIMEEEFLPCDANDPDGQLYIGCGHMEFHDLRTEK